MKSDENKPHGFGRFEELNALPQTNTAKFEIKTETPCFNNF